MSVPNSKCDDCQNEHNLNETSQNYQYRRAMQKEEIESCSSGESDIEDEINLETAVTAVSDSA